MSKQFNDLIINSKGIIDSNIIQQATDINFEIQKIGIEIDKTPTNKIFSQKISQNISRLVQSFEIQQAEAILELFDNIEKFELSVDIAEAQNIYFTKIFHQFDEIIENINKSSSESDKSFIACLLEIGKRLNINVDFYQIMLDKALVN